MKKIWNYRSAKSLAFLLGVVMVFAYALVSWPDSVFVAVLEWKPDDYGHDPSMDPIRDQSVGQVAKLRMPANDTVRLSVVESGSMNPVAMASISSAPGRYAAYQEDMLVEISRTNDSGLAYVDQRISGSEGGILIECPGYSAVYVDSSDVTDGLVVELEKGFRIVAHCRLLDGTPLAGVNVGLKAFGGIAVAGHQSFRPGPRDSLPSVWCRSDEHGDAVLEWVPGMKYLLIAERAKGHGLAIAPDHGSIIVPGPDIDLVFAPIYVNIGFVPELLGPMVTYSFQWSNRRIDNPMATKSCKLIEEDLQRQWPSAVVKVALVNDAEGLLPPIEGRVLTESGWFQFTSDWRRLDEFVQPWEWRCRPVGPEVTWGEVCVRVCGENGDPIDLGSRVSLAQGGEFPSFQSSYVLGSKRRMPVGLFRAVGSGWVYAVQREMSSIYLWADCVFRSWMSRGSR